MPNDTAQKRPQDPTRINITERYDAEYWSDRFGISVEKLRDLVNKVGSRVAAVKEDLQRSSI